MKKTISLKIVGIILFILIFVVLLSWRFILYAGLSNNVKTNVPEVASEIETIINIESFNSIELKNVSYVDGIYHITFFCKGINYDNTSECNALLKESVNVFEEITSHIDTSSKLFNSKLYVEFRINGSLPYNIKLCNFEYDFDSAQSKTGKTVFNKLVSVNIDFPLDDLSDIYDHITDLYTINIGSNCLVKESEFKSKYK